jgi:hypothetical protein
MFDAPKPLLLRRGDKPAVLDQTCRGIAVISIKAENDHRESRK